MPEGLPFICRPLSPPPSTGGSVPLPLLLSRSACNSPPPPPPSSAPSISDFFPPFPLLVFTKSGRLFRKGKKEGLSLSPFFFLSFAPFVFAQLAVAPLFHPENGNSPIFEWIKDRLTPRHYKMGESFSSLLWGADFFETRLPSSLSLSLSFPPDFFFFFVCLSALASSADAFGGAMHPQQQAQKRIQHESATRSYRRAYFNERDSLVVPKLNQNVILLFF